MLAILQLASIFRGRPSFSTWPMAMLAILPIAELFFRNSLRNRACQASLPPGFCVLLEVGGFEPECNVPPAKPPTSGSQERGGYHAKVQKFTKFASLDPQDTEWLGLAAAHLAGSNFFELLRQTSLKSWKVGVFAEAFPPRPFAS
jgi:hypothetical protein